MRPMPLLPLIALTFGSACATAIEDSGGPSTSTGGPSEGFEGLDAGPPPKGTADSGSRPPDTGSTSTAKPDTGSATPPPSTCKDCTVAFCDAESKACAADSKCVDQINCINACSTVDCQNKCIAAHPSTKADAFIKCLMASCKDACTKK